ncbi:hypothetical protein [uncultured Sphaerochaeta sp.]|uniref:hypothetical protein n=1 Tax=uncultured Sphaerochaeta sp. TaxID=886478 RepID=UPI002AA6FC16|nr:hypothetical protein [uncultured Sphaerochaeta sp.]
MKKKFVLTLALVLMVAGTLVAATPIEVSGSFSAGYDFEFTAPATTVSGGSADLVTILDFTGDFWKVSLDAGPVWYEDEDNGATAKAEIYLDKALAEQGVDMGDVALTLHVGTGVSGSAPSVLADKNDYADDFVTGVGMSTGGNFGVTVKYADMVEVYASAFPSSALPMVIGAKVMPLDGVEAAVGFTNDYSGNNAMTVSAKADVASLAGLEDIALAATGEFFLDLGAETSAIVADVDAEVAGIGIWAAYYNSMANVNYMAAKASYSTTVSDFDLSASFKLDLGDLATSSDEIYTIGAGAEYAMGGVTYALDAEYIVDGTFTLSPSVSISF